jgi:hypothetical protein
MLTISPDLLLPPAFMTMTAAILAKKGSGKTYTASVIAEELLKGGNQIVVIDITGAWWGLRSSADGQKSGFPILVAGGEHGDIPVEEHAGEVIAQAIVHDRFSCVLDLSILRKGQAHRFLGPFFETLYRQNRDALHLFCDEADFYAPQRPFGEEARTLGAMNDVVRRGRIRGIGCTLITQRPAVLNKDVLTQADVLVTLRLGHNRDLGAIKEWVDVHGDPKKATRMMGELPSLPIGTAWIWAPGWPSDEGIFQRVRIRKRETFDSGATPKPGVVTKVPKTLAKVDVDRLGASIRETAERVKQSDPKVLQAEVRRLQEQLAKQAPKIERVEVPVIREEQLARIEKSIDSLLVIVTDLKACVVPRPGSVVVADLKVKASVSRPLPVPVSAARSTEKRTVDPLILEKLAGGERKILTALAQYPEGRSKTQVALLTGYKHSGGGFNNYLSSLRSRGLMNGSGDRLLVTQAGLHALGPFDPLPTGQSLRDYWLREVGKAEREVLQVLCEVFPQALTKEEVASRTPSRYEPGGGGFNNALSRLRSLELISGRGEIRASETLFDGS